MALFELLFLDNPVPTRSKALDEMKDLAPKVGVSLETTLSIAIGSKLDDNAIASTQLNNPRSNLSRLTLRILAS